MSKNKSRVILTCVEYATRYSETVALPSIKNLLKLVIFSPVGVLRQILSDDGSLFTSEMTSEDFYRFRVCT